MTEQKRVLRSAVSFWLPMLKLAPGGVVALFFAAVFFTAFFFVNVGATAETSQSLTTQSDRVPVSEATRGLTCAGEYDAIVKLEEARYGAGVSWRALEGHEYGLDRFYDVALGFDGKLAAVGLTNSPDKESFSPFLTIFSSAGKTLHQDFGHVKDTRGLSAISAFGTGTGNGFAATGTVLDEAGRAGILLVLYDEDGKQILKKEIFDSKTGLTAIDIAVANDAAASATAAGQEDIVITVLGAAVPTAFTGPSSPSEFQRTHTAASTEKDSQTVSAASLEYYFDLLPFQSPAAVASNTDKISGEPPLQPQDVNRQSGEEEYSLILQFDKEGNLLRRRNFRPGPDNRLYSIRPLAEGGFLATGRLRIEDGRAAGWLVRLGPSAYLMWEQTYPRGRKAVLTSAHPHPAGGWLVSGYSDPALPPPLNLRAGWSMRIGQDGEPLWQRYWQGPYNFEAGDAVLIDDNMFQILLKAGASAPEQRDHARILSLTTRGQLIREESFMEGGHSVALHLVKMPDQRRVLAGYAQTIFSVPAFLTQETVSSVGTSNSSSLHDLQQDKGLASQKVKSYENDHKPFAQDKESVRNIAPPAQGEPGGIYDGWLLVSPAPGPFLDPCSPEAMYGNGR